MYDNVPAELRRLRQWVCWRGFPDPERQGKLKKVPVNPRTGGNARVNDPETWGGYDEAVAHALGHLQDAPKSGIGFVFTPGYFGVDIDSAESAIEDWRNGGADNIVGEFVHTLGSYAEYSVSGKGIHVICKGRLPEGGRRRGPVEMYDETRYFIVTGNACSEYRELADCTERIKPLHEKYIGGQAPTTGVALPSELPLNLSESEVIRLAEGSKQGGIFRDLYAGSYESYYTSQSEADLALCNMLAFWTRRDEALMESIFRKSGLMREKWDRRVGKGTYGGNTIRKAARECAQVYTPRPDYAVTIGVKRPEEMPTVQAGRAYSFDDTGNARRFRDRFGEVVRCNFTAERWMYYDGRRWTEDDNGFVRRMVDEVVEEMANGAGAYVEALPPGADEEKALAEYLRHVKTSRSSKSKTAMLKECEQHLSINTKDFDRDESLLCVTNGIVNTVTGELLDHDKDRLLSKICHAEYTDKVDCPKWKRFLDETFGGDVDLVRYVQKAVGYSITGNTQEHCAFFMYGTGRNGKSTFLDVLSEILGDYAVNIQPETLMVKQAQGGPTSDVARLKGARLVTTVEPNEGARLNEGLIKQLTGGDRVTASRKYENEFEFTPEFKLWMGTNHKPVIRGTDIGIWSRIQLIPFNVQVPPERVDKALKYKLLEEASGILLWAVEGCLAWRREGLKQPQAVAEASKEYKNEMDVLASFLEECTEDGGEADSGELFRSYLAWAKELNEYEMSSTKFGREMGKRYQKRKSCGNFYVGLHMNEKSKPYAIKIGSGDGWNSLTLFPGKSLGTINTL
jgi:putative DNA primase/helicase